MQCSWRVIVTLVILAYCMRAPAASQQVRVGLAVEADTKGPFERQVRAPLGRQPERQLRVGLYVSPDTEGLFESQFRTALSALPDVMVVSRAEDADVRLLVHAGCSPNCARAATYWGSLQITQVLQPWLLDNMVGFDTTAWNRLRPALTSSARLRTYERVIESGTFTWGAGVYEQEIKKYVATLDARCFELHRLGTRYGDAHQRGDSAAMASLQEALGHRQWICDAAGIYRR